VQADVAAERVLVIDDNALNAELAVYVLETAGFEVATASDAQAALARIATFQPDVALVDIQLPGMDGLTLVRLLKSQAATCDLVLMAFTAFAMKGDEAKMRAAGCDGYIAKPIDVALFAAQVRDCLRAARRPISPGP
jgi:two-component system cell cycle response regulator DivK